MKRRTTLTGIQHVYNHYDGELKVNIKLERNSKGYNWEVTVTQAKSPDEALQIIAQTEEKLKSKYGPQPEVTGS